MPTDHASLLNLGYAVAGHTGFQPALGYTPLDPANNLSDVLAQQTALNNITAVSGATNEYILTKDTATGNALWKVLSESDPVYLASQAANITAQHITDLNSITSFIRTLIDDASASDARTTLGLGTLATQNGTFSGSGTFASNGFTLTVPATGTAALLAEANVFTAAQVIQGTDATPLDLQFAAAYGTVASMVDDGTNNGWNGYTLRQIIASSQITRVGHTHIRISIKASSSSAINIGAVYVGHASSTGDAYDFEDTPTQITFDSGNPGYSDSAGSTKVSDAIAFELKPNRNLIIAMYASGTTGYVTRASQTGWSVYYKSGSDASTVDASGYVDFTSAANAVGVTLVESGTPSLTSAFTVSGPTLTASRPVTFSDVATFTDRTYITGGLFVDGSANRRQMRIQAHSSQTLNLFTLEKSDETLLGYVGPLGRWTLRPTATDQTIDTAGIDLEYTKTAAGADAQANYGFSVTMITAGSQNYTGSSVGVSGFAYHYGSATLSNQFGLSYGIGIASTGDVTNGTGILIQNYSIGSGVYTSITGLNIKNLSLYASPTTATGIQLDANTTAVGTNKFGLYIGDVSGASTLNYSLYTNAGDVRLMASASDKLGFHGSAPVAKQTITGSRAGNAALASLLTALATVGLFVDSSSA